MARPKKTIRNVQKNIGIEEEYASKLDIILFSEIENRVPHGAYSTFFNKLLRDYFDEQARIQANNS